MLRTDDDQSESCVVYTQEKERKRDKEFGRARRTLLNILKPLKWFNLYINRVENSKQLSSFRWLVSKIISHKVVLL